MRVLGHSEGVRSSSSWWGFDLILRGGDLLASFSHATAVRMAGAGSNKNEASFTVKFGTAPSNG